MHPVIIVRQVFQLQPRVRQLFKGRRRLLSRPPAAPRAARRGGRRGRGRCGESAAGAYQAKQEARMSPANQVPLGTVAPPLRVASPLVLRFPPPLASFNFLCSSTLSPFLRAADTPSVAALPQPCTTAAKCFPAPASPPPPCLTAHHWTITTLAPAGPAQCRLRLMTMASTSCLTRPTCTVPMTRPSLLKRLTIMLRRSRELRLCDRGPASIARASSCPRAIQQQSCSLILFVWRRSTALLYHEVNAVPPPPTPPLLD